jgi:hypothetical protein
MVSHRKKTALELALQFLFGTIAVNVVFLLTLFWMTFRDQSSAPSEGQMVVRILENPIFWAMSVVVFGLSFYLAR